MTDNVVDLASRRRSRTSSETCPGCTPEESCYPHRLEHLAEHLREARDCIPSLLVAASDVEGLINDTLKVLDGITRECLPAPHRRTP